MYAIVKCGGKQYKVEKGTNIKVEKIDAEVGSKVDLEALFVADDKGNVKAGKDAAATKVTAEIKSQGKSPKVLVAYFKAKKNVRKRQGHRQPYTELTIVSIK